MGIHHVVVYPMHSVELHNRKWGKMTFTSLSCQSVLILALRLVSRQRLSIWLSVFFLTEKKKKEMLQRHPFLPVGYEKVNMTDGCDLFATFEQRLSVDDCLSIVSWHRPQFVTVPVLHYWGQQSRNKYPFYLFTSLWSRAISRRPELSKAFFFGH